jgi:hypothetical protein
MVLAVGSRASSAAATTEACASRSAIGTSGVA